MKATALGVTDKHSLAAQLRLTAEDLTRLVLEQIVPRPVCTCPVAMWDLSSTSAVLRDWRDPEYVQWIRNVYLTKAAVDRAPESLPDQRRSVAIEVSEHPCLSLYTNLHRLEKPCLDPQTTPPSCSSS